MSWNYRVVETADGFALHEVHYDDDGKPVCRSAEPATFACDKEEGVDGLVRSLELALIAAEAKPILKDPWSEMIQWKPIADMPEALKDGRAILMWDGCDQPLVCRWDFGGWNNSEWGDIRTEYVSHYAEINPPEQTES